MGNERRIDFAQVALRLHEQDGLGATLQEVVELARESVLSDMAGVLLVQPGREIESAAVTDARVAVADRLQLDTGHGPCLEAIDDHEVFVIDDTAAEERWGRWCRGVVGLGVRSVLSLRLHTVARTLGALNLYSAHPHHYGDEEVRLGRLFAGHASVALATARTEAGLREGMEGRHLIGIAQGRLMERFALDQDQSFAVLRRYSQDRNIKLRAVARHVAESGELPS